ncbi:uncharacterized protein LOC126904118 [Daktulosphaira vitifoliae]|uniref:uncharacterized protein LOC126904118 n=1 Tax=Daktulosphaira vitifoliae TaxID=58002 RepID=UPI0021AAE7D8|nr:uncharacterized protein LOC126904118 [Daktulosphaira vitifoliae]
MKNNKFLFIFCGLISINCVKSDFISSKEDLKQCLIQVGILEENPFMDTDMIMGQDFITSIEYFYNKYNSQKYVKSETDETRFTQVDNENEKKATDTQTPEKESIHRDLRKTFKVSNDIREISNESKIENKNVIIIEEKLSKNTKNTKDKRDTKNCKKNIKNKEGNNKFEDQEKENVQFEERQKKIMHMKKDKRNKLIKKLSKEICGYWDSKRLEELFKTENPEKPFKACASKIHKCSAKFLTGNEFYLAGNSGK